MSSERDSRQRAAARARLERTMAARVEAAQRRRRMQVTVGASAAAVVLLVAVVWIIVKVAGGGTPTAAPSGPGQCQWIPDENAYSTHYPTPRPGVTEVGTPPTDVPRSGFQVLTFNTNQGVIKIEMDLSATPCTSASLAFLAAKKFYDGSTCHRMVDSIFALQCGDPSGTGSGGATYRFPDENLPVNKLPAYHEGDVAMANTGSPASNGTQFFFLWSTSTLPANYTLFGRVISGLSIVKKVAAGGHDGGTAGEGKPKIKLTIKSVSVGPVTPVPQSSLSPSPSPSS